MKHFTMHVAATFSFALVAESEEAAKKEARRMLISHNPVSCGKFRLGFDDPFVAVTKADISDSLRAELEAEEEGSL